MNVFEHLDRADTVEALIDVEVVDVGGDDVDIVEPAIRGAAEDKASSGYLLSASFLDRVLDQVLLIGREMHARKPGSLSDR